MGRGFRTTAGIGAGHSLLQCIDSGGTATTGRVRAGRSHNVLDGSVTRRPDPEFIDEMRALEPAYLEHLDPIGRSGFGGGAERWEAERRPLTKGIDRSGSFLDVGCANGWLARCVAEWCAEAGLAIEAFGVDIGAGLVAEARTRLTDAWAADAWNWEPPRRFTYVYSLVDLAPPDLLDDWLARLASWVEPDGRLVIGSYGSESRAIEPDDVTAALAMAGYVAAGSSTGGNRPIARFAWAQL